MKKIELHKKAFTLVEMLISMTIFSIIMVSVIMIYAVTSDISAKYDINREIRQNIKWLVEDISEEVRKNDIIWVSSNYWDPYVAWIGTRLKVWNIEYRIKKTDNLGNINNSFDCNDIKNICTIEKYLSWNLIWPLSNSKISFIDFNFKVSWKVAIPKVTISFTARGAIKNWLRPDLIKNSKLYFQTTFSERILEVR
jgi:prepilin-type N-terminal cleavage/methylation domain-containing protein